MNKLQMVDLRSQYEKIKEEIDGAIQEVLDETAFINGPQVKTFAKALADYNKVPYAITCGNGTDALLIAMMGLDFKPGDEVIVPAFTYVATVEVIALLGLKPVFIDVTPFTFQMDVSQLKDRLTKKTVAIVPVHLYGQCSNMEFILQFAAEHGLKVIEDTAQALGAAYSFSDGTTANAGTMGDIGTTSFFPSKNLGCYGDGGALFTHDEALAQKLHKIANHGQQKKYHHGLVGVNSRLDTLQAAILNVKLKYLDSYTEARRQVASRYDRALGSIDRLLIPAREKNSTHVFHQYTIQLTTGSRDEFKSYLQGNGIPSMIYYPLPVHFQEAYRHFAQHEDFPVAESLCGKVLSLPIHTEMKEEDQNRIIETIKKYF